MTMMTTIKDWQDDYFDFVKKVEEPMLKFADERADDLAKYVPERPSFMGELPKTVEFVEMQLKFRKRFVDEQIAFTRKMIKAMHPVFVKLDTAPKPEPKAAPKAAPKAKVTRTAPKAKTTRTAPKKAA